MAIPDCRSEMGEGVTMRTLIRLVKRVFFAYLVLMFIGVHVVAGAIVVQFGGVYGERFLHNPEAGLAALSDKMGFKVPGLDAWLAQRARDRALAQIARQVKFPPLSSWSGPGAHNDRTPWSPAYDTAGKPLTEFDLAAGNVSRVVARGVPKSVVRVSSAKDLVMAVERAKAGTSILIQPGTYKVNARVIRARAKGRAQAPIAVRAERLGSVILRMDTREGFKVSGPFWYFENLEFEGICPEQAHCEHAFHVVGNAQSFAMINNRIRDFNAQIKVNEEGGSYPDYGLLEGNSFYDTKSRNTDSPVAKVNIDQVNGWVVRGNLIGDFDKAFGNRVSYAAFMKGGGRGGVFEGNVIACNMHHNKLTGTQVGLSFGGGGMDAKKCRIPNKHKRNHGCEFENLDGKIRNNLILNCPRDAGIYLNQSAGTVIHNNLLYNTAGIDSRFENSSARIFNNIMEGSVRTRDGGKASLENNIELSGDDIADLYRSVAGLDFSLLDREAVLAKGLPVEAGAVDACGTRRLSATPDIGPFEYQGQDRCIFKSLRY